MNSDSVFIVSMRRTWVCSLFVFLFATIGLAKFTATAAAELLVTVEGIESAKGEIGIALFSSAEGFPLDNSRATQVWLPAQTGRISHRFTGLAGGIYAVSVGHDLNGNRKTDTNWVGIPNEPWAVSNNVRPKLRAPKFAEAAFTVNASDAETKITITVQR